MTEDCPGYDRDRQVCHLRPDDCEFVPTALARLDPGRAGGPAEPPDPPPTDVAALT